jgi:guanylate cyclase
MGTAADGRRGIVAIVARLVSIADEPTDDEDLRLRKRVGVVAGYTTIVAPLTLPFQAMGHPASVVLALGMSLFSAVNLALLARDRRSEPYVVRLLGSALVFVPLATAVGGGLTGASPGQVWAFLIPAYAIMALGPRRATRWFVAFIAMILILTAVDPLVHEAVEPAPYPARLLAHAQNVLVPLTVVFLLLWYTDTRRRIAEARADELLTNAIPRPIAARLRRGETRIAESYPETTVLFADLVGFTPWAQRTDPERVVSLLDELFSRFDALAVAHGVEKIKTIGDAYMAVAGAPVARPDHAAAGLGFARAMVEATGAWRVTNDLDLQIRVGLASGPAVGGIIGERRILFDLWGDTVNTASRMESSGIPGAIQVAESTWLIAPDPSSFVRREIEVKGLGTLPAYVMEG